MYTQRLTELHQHINSDGCALMCIAYRASVYQPHKFFTPQKVNRIYKQAMKDGAMKERAYIHDWAAVFALFGLTVDYLGHKARSYKLKPDEFSIERWALMIPHEGINWQHFITAGYDPWGSAGAMYHTSRTVAEGVLEDLRVFRVLEW